MTTIDQRILIPAPPNAVWAYIGNLENNPAWQVDCNGMSFLTQKREGVGTRWRETTASKQEFVYEITTWYEGLGYEYVFVDGGTFQASNGRIRLQEIPEGTIVQWTFNYELGGVFSGLRNALTTQRRIESDMIESLKTLWKVTKKQGSLEGYQARSLMQDGPQSPEARAIYQSRHDELAKSTSETPILHISEPPITSEDTRPGPAVRAAAQEEPQPPQSDTIRLRDERFAPPGKADKIEVQAADNTQLDAPPTTDESVPVHVEDAPMPELASADATQQTPASPVEDTAEDEQPASAPGADVTQTAPTPAPPPPSVSDTSEMSIWEVFGIPSPTDTQKMRAIQVAEAAEREYETEQQQAPEAEQTVEHTAVDPGDAEQPALLSSPAADDTEPQEPEPNPDPGLSSAPIITNIATQTMVAVAVEDAEAEDAPPYDDGDHVATVRLQGIVPGEDTETDEDVGGRRGLRERERRKLVRLRRPGKNS